MQQMLAQWLPEITKWRRDIHQHPELGFNEHRTADIVAEKLNSFGYQVHRGLAKTGVVGTLRQGITSRAIGLRADMDALPIQETNNFAHCSVNANVMHACGHDGHTAMLLGAARCLAQSRNFDGTVHLIFQPAEEGMGGAKMMIEDGLFDRFPMDSIYGMHNWPGVPVGRFGVCTGPMLASNDNFDITITGKGGHAAMPHQSIDPIIIASELVGQLQTLISRNTNPVESAVLSVTQLQAGSAYNVIAEKAVLRGTLRTLSPETQSFLKLRMKETVAGLCAVKGAAGKLVFDEITPVLVNTEQETQHAIATATAVVGACNVNNQIDATMGAEDFAYMLQEKPGCYIFSGNGGIGDGEPCMLHNPGYDFNDDSIQWGVAYWCQLVETLLKK